jgi:hypothetical protein
MALAATMAQSLLSRTPQVAPDNWDVKGRLALRTAAQIAEYIARIEREQSQPDKDT